MKKLLNVIKKIICVFGGIILLLAVQASISSILRLINPIEEPAEEKKKEDIPVSYKKENISYKKEKKEQKPAEILDNTFENTISETPQEVDKIDFEKQLEESLKDL